jgi:hypothetical protein
MRDAATGRTLHAPVLSPRRCWSPHDGGHGIDPAVLPRIREFLAGAA